MKKIWTSICNEKGAMVFVEGAFVFPIVFFVVAFLIFYGNAMYEKSRIDSIVLSMAIEGATCVADPYNSALLDHGVAKSPGLFPTNDYSNMSSTTQPYRYLFGVPDIETAVETRTKSKIEEGSLIFFKKEKQDVLSVDAQMENHVFSMKFTVSADYQYHLPFRFIFMEMPPLITLSSKASVNVNDCDEFIRNTDLAIDIIKSIVDSDIGQTIKEKISNLKHFLPGGSNDK